MDIPQVLGYTLIAGMPVLAGLYTVLLPIVMFSVFGSSRHLIVAADFSHRGYLFWRAIGIWRSPASPSYIALAGMVALLTAGFLLIARIFKLGFSGRLLASRTVPVGFLAEVGLPVAISMLGDMLGVGVTSRRTLLRRRGRSSVACRNPLFRRLPYRPWSPVAFSSADALHRACQYHSSRFWVRSGLAKRSVLPREASW